MFPCVETSSCVRVHFVDSIVQIFRVGCFACVLHLAVIQVWVDEGIRFFLVARPQAVLILNRRPSE